MANKQALMQLVNMLAGQLQGIGQQRQQRSMQRQQFGMQQRQMQQQQELQRHQIKTDLEKLKLYKDDLADQKKLRDLNEQIASLEVGKAEADIEALGTYGLGAPQKGKQPTQPKMQGAGDATMQRSTPGAMSLDTVNAIASLPQGTQAPMERATPQTAMVETSATGGAWTPETYRAKTAAEEDPMVRAAMVQLQPEFFEQQEADWAKLTNEFGFVMAAKTPYGQLSPELKAKITPEAYKETIDYNDRLNQMKMDGLISEAEYNTLRNKDMENRVGGAGMYARTGGGDSSQTSQTGIVGEIQQFLGGKVTPNQAMTLLWKSASGESALRTELIIDKDNKPILDIYGQPQYRSWTEKPSGGYQNSGPQWDDWRARAGGEMGIAETGGAAQQESGVPAWDTLGTMETGGGIPDWVPEEEAETYKELRNSGMTDAEIRAKFNV